MANEKHLALLRQGVNILNYWRKKNSNMFIDLSGYNFSSYNLSGANLSGVNLSGANLSGANLSRANLKEAYLSGANLSGAKLSGFNLSGANLSGANLNLVDLSGAYLKEADLSGVKLKEADLSGANLSGVNLSGANLKEAYLNKANLIGAKLNQANLKEADLSWAKLNQVDLSGAYLIWANLSGAYLIGANLIEAKLNQANLSRANLSWAKLNQANLSGANLSWAYLCAAKFNQANLNQANLSGAKLKEADLSGANLKGANLSGANLDQIKLKEADLSGVKLKEADLSGANLNQAKLKGSDLSGANLSDFNLSGANLKEADLSGANLIRIQALGTNFTTAKLTGACLEDWNINSTTKLGDIDCKYIYLKENQQERRPSSGEFAPGEFTKLFQKALETVDLIFVDGIDWKAFLSSFQELQTQYGEENISVQAIEKKSGGAFVIRLEVPEEVNKAEIECQARELYEIKLSALEARYHAELQAKNEQIVIYRQHNASLENIINMLGNKPIQNIVTVTGTAESKSMSESYKSKYDLSNAQVGGIVDTAQAGSHPAFNQHNYASEQNLAEAAAEIQQLLEQLDKTYSTDTTTDKMTIAAEAIKQIDGNPTLTARILSALKVGSVKAFEQFLSHPAASFVIGALEDWQKTKGN